MSKVHVLVIGWFLASPVLSFSQENISRFTPKQGSFDIEYRPRAEYRSGYGNLRYASDQPVGIVSHRLRFNGNFTWDGWSFYGSLQDVRIWGAQDPRAVEGGISMYEAFATTDISKHLKLKIGRQKISLGEEHLFGQNNWRQAGGKHDATALFVHYKKWSSNFYGAYNQLSNADLNAIYTPSFDWYQFLAINYTTINLGSNTEVILTNFVDGYQNDSNLAVYAKSTNGGMINYHIGPAKLSAAGYYQFGKLKSGLDQQAYLLYGQAELKLSNKQYTIGAEHLSGTDQNQIGVSSNSFLSQYRGFHRHNGYMDYNANLMALENHEGLTDIYFKQKYTVKGNTDLKIHWHTFLTASDRYKSDNSGELLSSFWGNEIDLVTEIELKSYCTLEIAYDMMFASPTRSALYGGSERVFQQFAFIELNFEPNIWNKSPNEILLETNI